MMESGLDQYSEMDSISNEFRAMREALEAEQDKRTAIRAAVKDLQEEVREATSALQAVHQGLTSVVTLCEKCRGHLPRVRELLKQLASSFPSDQYYRYHDQFRMVCQSVSFLGAFLHYLEMNDLISRSDLAAMMEVSVSAADGFHLTLEDMLQGFLQLASELARLAINSVIHGDFRRPLSIAAFLNQINSAFQLLNLKNDFLRRRYDGLKYDVKKVEEVVYDLAIRGLKPDAAPPSKTAEV